MAGLNIKLLRKEQERLNKLAKEEYKENLQREILDFVKTSIFKDAFINTKSKKDHVKESSRVLNHWEEKGLISKPVDDKGKWRKYNRIESIWLDIVSDLREFGFSIEKIKSVRDSLYNSNVKSFIPIEYAVIYSVIKQPMTLMIYLTGEISLLPKKNYSEQVLYRPTLSHICVDFQYYISQEFPNNKFHELAHVDHEKLSDKEVLLLYYLRTGDYKTIKINMKDGDVYLLEGERVLPTNSKVADVLMNNAYQTLEIRTEAGQIVSFKSKDKIKF